jgi:CelD/BcsL family acetyltransferase involved in cellulose biosynthesis
MDIQPIRCIEHLRALQPEWLHLYARAGDATPFQRPEWLLPWWDVFGSGEMFSFAARAGGSLVALAPMFLHTWNNRRQVTFLGNGVSDHLGFLLDPAYARAAAAAIFDAIGAERLRWDLCDLQDLPARSALCGATSLNQTAHALRPQYTCSYISLPPAWDEYHQTLPHGLRRNLRRYRERLDGLGRVTLESVREPQAMGEIFDALVSLHRARWESKNDAGMLGTSALERFHRAAARALAGAGMVRLHAMRVDGRIVAVVYLLIDGASAYSYLGGFDPALSRYSPGALALEYALQQCVGEGVRVFDFLRGDEAYKADWGAVKESSYRLLLWHDQAPLDLLEAA